MKKVFISGPYSGETPSDVWDNIQAARDEAMIWWSCGAAVFCPHLNSAFMDGGAPREFFLAGDLEFLMNCNLVVALTGWDSSDGAKAEVKVARELGIPIYYECHREDLQWEDSYKKRYTLDDIEAICRTAEGTST